MPARRKDKGTTAPSTLSRLEERLKAKAEPRLTEKLTIRLDRPTYEALESLAKEHNLSISELTREVLTMLAEEYQNKRPVKQLKLFPEE
jgi:predicted DNA-binding ribbon-helix-helix protein